MLSDEATLSIAPELVAIVERACAQDPADRFQTARELHDALERYLDGDRDLEARTRLAAEHARRAAAALARDARDEAGHEVGRALGLDPQNAHALRTLMLLLTTAPVELPPAATAEMHERWRARHRRTLRASTLTTLTMLALVPLIAWMGVRDGTLFAAFIALTLAAVGTQYAAAESKHWLPVVLAFTFTNSAVAVLGASMGLLGVVPAAFAILAMAFRLHYTRALHGVLVLLGSFAALTIPLLAFPPRFTADGALAIAPHMNAFPHTATLVSLALGLFGTLGVGVLYGRLYSKEIERADRQLVFHAWQLRQLLPPAP